MVSFQQHFQSLQVQFNLFCDKAQKAPASSEVTEMLVRIVAKANVALQSAQGPMARARGDLQKLSLSIQLLHHDKSQALVIRRTIQELNVKLFTPNAEGPQSASLNVENDEDLATANWLVARHRVEVKRVYPKTCTHLNSCITQVASGKFGDVLREAFVDSSQEVWSREQLVKLLIIHLARSGLNLASLDCFVRDAESDATMQKFIDWLQNRPHTVVELFLLHPDKLPQELQECQLALNRFVEGFVLDRKEALGLMNMLQETLTSSEFLNQIEQRLQQQGFDNAFNFVLTLQPQAKKVRGLLYLADSQNAVAELNQIRQPFYQIPQQDDRDIALQEFVQLILSKPGLYGMALETVDQFPLSYSKRPFYLRIAQETTICDPETCLSILQHKLYDRDPLAFAFFQAYCETNLERALEGAKCIRARELQQQVFSLLIPHLESVSIARSPSIANSVHNIFRKVNSVLFTNAAKEIVSENPLMALCLAQGIQPPVARSTAVNRVCIALHSAAEKLPDNVFEALKRLGDKKDKSPILYRLIQVFEKSNPLKAVRAFSEIPLTSYSPLFCQRLRQCVATVPALPAAEILLNLSFAYPMKDTLLSDLFERLRVPEAILAYNLALSMSDQTLKSRTLALFYRDFNFDDFSGVDTFARAIGDPQERENFIALALDRVPAASFHQRYQLLQLLPGCRVRDEALEHLSNSLYVGDNLHLALEVLGHISESVRRYQLQVSRAALCYEDDQKAVHELLSKLPTPWRDRLCFGLVQKLYYQYRHVAIHFARMIQDQDLSNKAYMYLAQHRV